MVVVPGVIPDTNPVPAPIVAAAVLLLAQIPKEVASDKDAVRPVQILVTPAMASGKGFTVTEVVARHPVVNV
jgi:hypothetical protein